MGNGFRKPGQKPTPWLEEPFRIVPLTPEEQEEKAEAERQKAIALFNAMIPKDEDGGEDDG